MLPIGINVLASLINFPNNRILVCIISKYLNVYVYQMEKKIWTNISFLHYGLEFPGGACYKSWAPLQAKWTKHYKGHCDGLVFDFKAGQ